MIFLSPSSKKSNFWKTFLESLAANRPNFVDFRVRSELFQRSQCHFNEVRVDFITFKKVMYHNFESYQKFLSETSPSQTCIMGYIYFGLDLTLACTTHTRKRRQCKSNQIAQFYSERGSEKFWMCLNVIDHNFSHYGTCRIIIFDPRWVNAPSSARQSRQTSFSKNVTYKEEKVRIRCAGLILDITKVESIE